MEFWSFPTQFQAHLATAGKKRLREFHGVRGNVRACRSQFYEDYTRAHIMEYKTDRSGNKPARMLSMTGNLCEDAWFAANCPFYNVWPAIIPALLRVDLSKIRASDFLPMSAGSVINIRFPKAGGYVFAGGRNVRSMLVASTVVGVGKKSKTRPPIFDGLPDHGPDPDMVQGLFFTINNGVTRTEQRDYGQVETPCSLNYKIGIARGDATFGDIVEDNLYATAVDDEKRVRDEEVTAKCLAIYVTLSLIVHDKNSELVNRVVLSKDRAEYERSKDPALVAKAKGKGVLGWEIGRELEKIPHYRRPHFGLRWTGVGRTVPKIVPVSGAIVHRDKLKQVPHGYLDEKPPTEKEQHG